MGLALPHFSTGCLEASLLNQDDRGGSPRQAPVQMTPSLGWPSSPTGLKLPPREAQGRGAQEEQDRRAQVPLPSSGCTPGNPDEQSLPLRTLAGILEDLPPTQARLSPVLTPVCPCVSRSVTCRIPPHSGCPGWGRVAAPAPHPRLLAGGSHSQES